jgi:uncharacterized membrane protein YeaQ/YmgE (transglycosylase-associated protein family)
MRSAHGGFFDFIYCRVHNIFNLVDFNLVINSLNKFDMDIILWIVFGALVGWIASLIMKTDAEQGSIMNIVVGIIGAVIGGWVMNMFGNSGVSGFNIWSFLVALLGAVILIAIVKAVRRA